jgi:hypothetical protein
MELTKREKVLIWCLAGVVALALGALGYVYRSDIKSWFTKEEAKEIVATVDTNTTTTPETLAEPAKVVEENSNLDLGVTWIAPAKVGNLGLIKSSADSDIDAASAVYYQIANLENGQQLYLAIVPAGMGYDYLRYLKTAENKYEFLLKHSDISDYTTAYNTIPTGTSVAVTINSTTVYAGITDPDLVFDAKNNKFSKGWVEGLFADLKAPEKIATTQYGDLYQLIANSADASGVSSYNTFLKHADGTYRYYTLSIPFNTDNSIPQITFAVGGANTKTYSTISAKNACGSARGSMVALGTNLATRLVETGVTSTSDKIYAPKSADDVIYKEMYTVYQVGREGNTQTVLGTKDYLTYADFVAAKPIFLWKNPYSQYMIYMNNEFGGLAECGKPVVYLYPEKDMNVSVKVGAKVTKSEPAYNTGWNVLAKKGGQLVLNGANYPYLFWEGKGNGEYPEITKGIVVKKADVKATLESNLKSLGLNSQESADFMEFWLPKMPTTPYTRISWFGTKEMNILAPLSISPAPDTTIRIFIDFEGLNQPIEIAPQYLGSIERKGFTVVEWGGLLK